MQDMARRQDQVDTTGQRFLFNARVDDPTFQAITVLQNWQSVVR